VDLIQSLHSLDFNQQVPLYEKVRDLFAHDCAIVGDLDGFLLVNNEPCLAEFMREGVLIDFLEKSNTQTVADRKRRLDHLVGQLVQSSEIGVQLRSFAVARLRPQFIDATRCRMDRR